MAFDFNAYQQNVQRGNQRAQWDERRKVAAQLQLEREKLKLLAQQEENKIEKAKYEKKAKAVEYTLKGREAGSKLAEKLRAGGFSDEEISQRLQPLLSTYTQGMFPDQDTTAWMATTIRDIVDNLPKQNGQSLQQRAESMTGGKLPPNTAVGVDAKGNPYVTNAIYNKGFNAQQEGLISQAQQGQGFVTDAADRLLDPNKKINTRAFALQKFADSALSPAFGAINLISGGGGPGIALSGQKKILDTSLNNLRNVVAYLYSGKQINEMERRGLREMIPTDLDISKQDTATIRYKLNNFYKMYSGILQRMQKGSSWNATLGQYEIPSGEELPARYQEIQAPSQEPKQYSMGDFQ